MQRCFALMCVLAGCGPRAPGMPSDGNDPNDAATIDTPPPPPPGAFPLWAAPSLDLIRRDTPARSDTQIELWAARGETESFQIVVQAPAGGLTNVNVTVPDLRGPSTISQLTLYRE